MECRDLERRPCPCCGYRTVDGAPPGSDEICAVCGWQDDDVQYEDPTFEGGPNRGKSLEQARAEFDERLSQVPHLERHLSDEWGVRDAR